MATTDDEWAEVARILSKLTKEEQDVLRRWFAKLFFCMPPTPASWQ